jgi:signal transduction histidine kinase/CheY-like chemotaxis protein/HPt (histidine-containing phosphotransfer) domain-containing protein
MKQNALLKKQIEKYLPGKALSDEALQQFLDAVNESYNSFEKDKRKTEKAFFISNEECKEINNNLQEEVTLRNTTIEKLKIAIRNIQGDEQIFLTGKEDDLIEIVTYLDQQITRRKEIEKELIAAKQAAEASSHVKEVFLANMSHEIRTPLNGIIGMSNQLNKTSLTEKQKLYLNTIQTASENLSIIINDILDLSKAESGKFALEIIGFNARETIERPYLAMKHRAEEKGLALTISFFDENLSYILLGDPYRLNQIILNLLSNAIKFTPKGSVDISCRVLEDIGEKQKVQITVSDTGIGIDTLYLKDLFENFSQEDSSFTRKFGGTGLGMSICKQLVELMNGEIKVVSEKGKGTAVSVIIDFEKGSISNIPVEEFTYSNTNILKGKTILITDDNEMNRLLGATILSNFGAEIMEATNGAEAIDCLQQSHFDLVLMDIQMPVMDGIETTKVIRDTISKEIPIVAFTAFASKGDNIKYLDAGMNDYVPKPFKEGQLLQVVCGWIAKMQIISTIETIAGPHSALYDLSKLNTMSGGNQVFVDKMLRLFIEHTPLSIKNLTESYSKKDFEAVRKVAHSLKTAIDNMGIQSLKNEIREIEHSAETYQTSRRLEFLITKVETVITKVVYDLSSHLLNN